jgi:hypothetical protein
LGAQPANRRDAAIAIVFIGKGRITDGTVLLQGLRLAFIGAERRRDAEFHRIERLGRTTSRAATLTTRQPPL